MLINQRLEKLRQQLYDLEKIKLPAFKKGGHFTFVDHEDAAAEKRHIEYLVMINQVDNLKEAIKELETMKAQSAKCKVQNLAQS